MRRSSSPLALFALFALSGLGSLAACDTAALQPCVHPPPEHADGQVPPDMGPLPQVCRHIYVVDAEYRFSAFDPTTFVFTDIGTLKCKSAEPNATPFSMSVARDDTAWVLYDTGELFHVDIATANCFPTGFKSGQDGSFTNFGMGFSSNSPGSADETLFIADTPAAGTNMGTLASLDLATLLVNPIAPLVGSPELTGTGQAELWGFSPTTMPPFVAQIDKTTAATSNVFNLDTLAGTPSAWAFAFWGGDFFVFLQRATDPSTVVYRLNRATAQLDTVVPDSRRTIVGAGVSSCAPVGQ